MMPEPGAKREAGPRRWLGMAGPIALVVFVLGRLALEPVRDAPHFDSRGMEAYGATETYLLRRKPAPVKIAFFGSSQSVWAILAGDVARDLSEDPERVRNLATEGGTPFDMWNLIRRNEGKLAGLRVAVVEVNPFTLRQALDADSRVHLDLAQHGSLAERLLLARKVDRLKLAAEWVLPFLSVRRSLESALLGVVNPDPGLAMYPSPEQRTEPAAGWLQDGKRHQVKGRHLISPEAAARRLVGSWRVSKLQDLSLRESLAWFERRGVRVVFHEPPVHPDVARVIRDDPGLARGHEEFLAYVRRLRPQPLAHFLAPDPSECGLRTEHMADRTHVNELGAHLYSHHLAARIRPHLP